MANPSGAQIKFNASFMAGYNNPEITVLTLVTDGGNTIIDYPDYRKILRILRSGRVPILHITSTDREYGQLLQLNTYSTPNQIISFIHSYLVSSDVGVLTQVDFRPDKPPVMHTFPLNNKK